jgi:hypothetical protein
MNKLAALVMVTAEAAVMVGWLILIRLKPLAVVIAVLPVTVAVVLEMFRPSHMAPAAEATV